MFPSDFLFMQWSDRRAAAILTACFTCKSVLLFLNIWKMSEDDHFGNIEKMPIYLKGMELYDLTHQICELIPEDDDRLQTYKRFMLEDASMLSVKVAGAEGADLYDIRMENAAIIRKAARDLLTHCRGLESFGFKEINYLDLIREGIEEYRLLFIEWVAGFDQWNYMIDRWGLFNPPGVGPFDKDPDDDIPWDGEIDGGEL